MPHCSKDFAGLTPTTAPGASTIRTADLARFLEQARPVVIDTVSYSWGRSIPGAVGLKFAGLGGSLTDPAQDRLRSKMRELTGWRSQPADCRGRLEFRTLRRTQSGIAPRRARLCAGLLVPRRQRGMGGGRACRRPKWRCRTGDSRPSRHTGRTCHPSDRALDQPRSRARSCRSCSRSPLAARRSPLITGLVLRAYQTVRPAPCDQSWYRRSTLKLRIVPSTWSR